MSLEASLERRKQSQAPVTGNGNGVVSSSAPSFSTHRLRLQPKEDHKSETYEDLQLEFSPLLFSMLERHLPPSMLNVARDLKLQYMRDILLRYAPEGERNRVQRHREYRQKIISNYQVNASLAKYVFELDTLRLV
ncbi:uncharacterized PKHD-type hydroxylase At1g22950-like [Cucurbita pepo subsp. pepo]|uniref:uncharacterized PKHD-type hydroxylase At1g22950-like n=1 Tax=Cucurbita pepo subsp. pepo TaxID=3664 RepID=UPI000C9D6B96|nr:uncharacterized PKHD-type hydroxylase At1g22950-like [Cucurbita pepo subsp. pepo]